MADRIPVNVVEFAKTVVDAFVTQQAQIAELQNDRTTLLDLAQKLSARVDALEGHAETVTGETGLTSQLGDLSVLATLQERLSAAMPPAEPEAAAAPAAPVEAANAAEAPAQAA